LAPLFAAVFAVVLTPTSALADANPNNHGHHYHYGWVNHHSPPAPAPAPKRGGGPATNGPKSSIVTVVPAALAPQAPTAIAPETPVVGPPAGIVTTVESLPVVRNLWLVAILLATFLAANVTLAVLAASRGGHYAIKRAFAPAGSRV